MKLLLLLLLLVSAFASGNVKVHKQTKQFIDIEVPVGDVFIHCTNVNPEEKNFLLTVYLLDGRSLHEFDYRTVRSEVECQEEKATYHGLLKESRTARLVGISPLPRKMSPAPKGAPVKFRAVSSRIIWTFIRLQTPRACKPYFTIDCTLPENYWGGVIPE